MQIEAFASEHPLRQVGAQRRRPSENEVMPVLFSLLSPPAAELGSKRAANRSAIGPRAIVESEWPERTRKLPPKPKQG